MYAELVYVVNMQKEPWKMQHTPLLLDFRKEKGVLERSFLPIKSPLHKESTHSEVLAKCTNQVES